MLGRTRIAWMMVVAAGMAAPSRGADAPAESGSVRGLIDDLRSPVYATREAATVALMREGVERRGEVEEALAKEKDAEAALRLARVAVHLYMKEQTPLTGDVGVLGISFSMKMEAVQLDPKSPTMQMAIVVVKTEAGFPAAEMLEVGDRILAVNGERLSMQMDQDDFRKKVNDTKPGQVVGLTVLRDGKVVEVGVKVAGLRASEVPLFKSIVDRREEEAAAYLAQLRRGVVGRTVVVPGVEGEGNEGGAEGP